MSIELHSRDRSGSRADGGFTLIELLVVITILPLVVGAISVALISVFSLQGGVAGRLSNSGDAQATSAHFISDVQSASAITTVKQPQNLVPAQTAPCGSSSQIFGVKWGDGTEVSYVEVTKGTLFSLLRYVCQAGNLATPVATSVVSHNIQANLPSPTIAPSTSNAAAAAGWTLTASVTSVTFPVSEPESTGSYTFTLVGLPGASAPPSQQSTIAAPPTTTCTFATPGSGTYAATLCFVDFTSFTASLAAAPGCQHMSAAVVNTPYSLTFCLSVSGGPVAPASIPTYFAPPTSEAFLGNNGFYTGIQGNAALYETTQGSAPAVLTFSQIQVLDSNGNPATGWQLATGDAESTDAGESMTWTSNQNLNLLPDNSVTQIGNACATTLVSPYAPQLTGVGTKTVTCSATVSSDKTGTVMLSSIAPTTLTVTLTGGGLQAAFLGLLLA